MPLSRNVHLLFFAGLFISGQLTLVWATGIIEAQGGTVPDLMPLGTGIDSMRTVFLKLVAIDPTLYLLVLWSGDILFPLGYGGFFNTLLKPLGRFAHIPLCAMGADFLENVFATAIITIGPSRSLLIGFTIAHTIKFVGLMLTFAGLGAVTWQYLKRRFVRAV